MTKTMCPISKSVCYTHDDRNNSENEADWISCAFEDDAGRCGIARAAAALSRMEDNFWKNNNMDDAAFGVFITNQPM